jgi:hypothetical protein
MLIDDSTINALLQRPEMVREFPFLLATTENAKVCCGRSRRVANYPIIKQTIAGMPTERKELFKKMLGVLSCRVVFQVNNSISDITI